VAITLAVLIGFAAFAGAHPYRSPEPLRRAEQAVKLFARVKAGE
jgi:hypothetical protein